MIVNPRMRGRIQVQKIKGATAFMWRMQPKICLKTLTCLKQVEMWGVSRLVLSKIFDVCLHGERHIWSFFICIFFSLSLPFIELIPFIICS